MPKSKKPEPTSTHQAIQMEELSRTPPNEQLNYPYSLSSSSSSEEDVQYSKEKEKEKKKKKRAVPDLIPLPHFEITIPDILFSCTVLVFVVLELGLDIVLVVWHACTGHQWAAAITALFIGCGGVALLSQFWGINREQLKLIYDHATCVRLSVNSFPWMFTLITAYSSSTTSIRSYRNPAMLHKHVKLQELTRSLLKIQTLAQAAPLSVTQLVVLLEDIDQVTFAKASTTTLSIVVNLTLMMVANLPLKSDVSHECVPRAAYSPYSRLFVGLRMICNFASRTMSLSLYLASFRCSVFHLISSSNSPALPHLIPLAVILIPRIIFAWTHYFKQKLVERDPTTTTHHPNHDHHPSFLDTTLMYVASVFFPFGDVLWLYVYVTLETIVFVVFGFVFGEIVGGEGCIGLGVEGIVYFCVFLVFFGVVPCVVPWVSRVVQDRNRNSSRMGRNF